MPEGSTLALFAVAAVTLLVIPGPAVLYIVTRSVDQGRAAGLASVCGVHVGTLVHVAAAALGLSALLVSSATAYHAVRWLGAAYLIWLGVRRLLARDEDGLGAAGGPGPRRVGLRRIFAQGVVVNVLNPKTALFFFAFLPQFVHPDEPDALLHMLGLSAVFMAITFSVFALYGIFASAVRRHVVERPRVIAWLRRSFAASFVALSAKLAFSSR